MADEPGSHFGVLVVGVVVDDGVNRLTGRHRGLDLVEEADELLMVSMVVGDLLGQIGDAITFNAICPYPQKWLETSKVLVRPRQQEKIHLATSLGRRYGCCSNFSTPSTST